MNINRINILLIEDEAYDVRRVRSTLQHFSESLLIKDVVSDGRSALELIEKNRDYDVIIMDFQISGGLKGEKLIRRIKTLDQTLQIIVITKMTMNITDFDFANTLLEAGAIWYCTKYPGDIEDYIYQPTDFILNIINAAETRKLHKKNLSSRKRLRANVENILEKKKIVGESPAIQTVKQQIQSYGDSNANVLILGSSGTGKELVATHMHYRSQRKLENFVPINCGSLPDHLVESELFGFEKGAFTGASTRKKGLFEVANNGTVFLDEITELPLAIQSKLLRVIQEKEIDKIGRTDKVSVNVRILAATNRTLFEEVQKKNFREDLYYRLNVVSITVPPLRERHEDVPLLIDHFLKYYSTDMNVEAPVIEEEALAFLKTYHWPGNVRELQNVVQRFLFTASPRITQSLAELSIGVLSHAAGDLRAQVRGFWEKDNILPWREMEGILQEQYFRFVRENAGSDAEAAGLLGLAPPNYHRMCKRLGLK